MDLLSSVSLIVAFGLWFLVSYSLPSLKKYRTWYYGLIVLPLSFWTCYAALHSLNVSRDTHLVSKQIVAIRNDVQKLPPTADRGAEFMRRLKAVDSGEAPPDVKRALSEYIVAMEQAFAAVRNHQDTPALEQTCQQKAKALTEAINRQ